MPKGGGKRRDRVIKIGGEVPVGFKIPPDEFALYIEARTWDSIGRVNQRPFEEAREYVRSLGLKGQQDWYAYCQSGKRPPDIPSNPDKA